MKIAIFTSFTGDYLPNARILADSIKEVHPEWTLYALFNDRWPETFDWADEAFDEVVLAEWLGIERAWSSWAFSYSVVEFCTATKGAMARLLLETLKFDAVVYLDPDIWVNSRLDRVVELLSDGVTNVILTPHLTDPEESTAAIWSHEVAALKHGTFNLGFFAIKRSSEGLKFLEWWNDRLLDYSFIDFNEGLFTDQKWCNLAPYLFEGVRVITDRTYNVATWNGRNRNLSRSDDGNWLVNGEPLTFYHFSGFGRDFEWADLEVEKFGIGDGNLRTLWEEYKLKYQKAGLDGPNWPWYWGQIDDVRSITQEERRRAKTENFVNPYRALASTSVG